MASVHSVAYYADTLSDLFYQTQNVAGLKIVGAGTGGNVGECYLSISNIAELKGFELHERYIDIGAALTLERFAALKKALPECLREAAMCIGNMAVRNIATIGGNICLRDYYHTLYSPLLALDARLEIRRTNEVHYVKMAQFTGVPQGCVLTRIRVPRGLWPLSIFRTIGPKDKANRKRDNLGSYTFLADMDKDTLSSLRIAYAGVIALRFRELENNLIGTRLPLSSTLIQEYIESAIGIIDKAFADRAPNPTIRQSLSTLINYSLCQLT